MTSRTLLALLLLVACQPGGGDGTDESSTSGNGSSGDPQETIVPTSATVASSSTDPTATGSGSTSGGVADSSSGSESSTGEVPPASICDDYDVFTDALVDAADQETRLELTTAFLRAAQYSASGLPLRCDDRVVFLSREGGGSVAGEFNEWEPGVLPMEALVDGFDLYAAEAEISNDAGMYKVVFGESFVADPLARRYGWDEFGEFSLVDARTDAPHHERWPAFAEAIGDLEPRSVRVYVPAAANAGEDVDVLIVHDGQNMFAPDAFFGGWRASQTATALIDDGSIRPLIIVAIDNTSARLDEYSHVQDQIGGDVVGGRGDEYADFVVDGVLPFANERYPTLEGPQHTAVLGSSMGGLISLHLLHRHTDVFGYAGSMSGTLGWGTFALDNETIEARYQADPPTGAALYIDSGGDGPCPQDGSDNYCETLAFTDVLRDLGWTDEADLFYRWDPGAGHNEAAWADRLAGALRNWFPGA